MSRILAGRINNFYFYFFLNLSFDHKNVDLQNVQYIAPSDVRFEIRVLATYTTQRVGMCLVQGLAAMK